MGIALPTVTQPGETTTAVLGGWLLIFAALVLGLTLAKATNGILLSVLFGAAGGCVYGLLGDFNDFLFGFWGAAGFILLPAFVLLGWLLHRLTPSTSGRPLLMQWLLFGIAYPCVAGLDPERSRFISTSRR